MEDIAMPEKRERYIAQAMAATADIDAMVWSEAVIDGLGTRDRFELLKELRGLGCQLEHTPFGYRVYKLKTSVADTAIMVDMVRAGIMVREGEVVTEALALERAKNIVMGLGGAFDFMRRVFS
jgi:hypothetical protein